MTRTTLLSLAAASAIVSGTAALAATAPPTQAEHGFQVFMTVGCYECHGTVGQGGGVAGPRLAPDPLPADRILSIVRKPLKEMPPYNEQVLSDADVLAIRAYLATVKPPPPIDSLEQFRTSPK